MPGSAMPSSIEYPVGRWLRRGPADRPSSFPLQLLTWIHQRFGFEIETTEGSSGSHSGRESLDCRRSILSNGELDGPYNCGRCGIPLRQWVYVMTASEANRQRVLMLLLVERSQTREEFNGFYKEISAMNPGEWPPSEKRQLSTVEHSYSSQVNPS
jgi:hypothetical protein